MTMEWSKTAIFRFLVLSETFKEKYNLLNRNFLSLAAFLLFSKQMTLSDFKILIAGEL